MPDKVECQLPPNFFAILEAVRARLEGEWSGLKIHVKL